MGFVDRGGSRESKGNSLRRSKKNPGAAAARAAGAKQALKPPAQPEVPPALSKPTKKNEFFDTAAALLSRQFDADLDDVIDRAEQNCAGVLVWSADIDKQQQVVTMSQENAGFIYAAVGLHPDNVRGTHQREIDKWFQLVADYSKVRGCVAILSGLNLMRDTATHFPQELVLKTMLATGKANGRAIVLHCAPRHNETAERLLTLVEEWLTENGDVSPIPIILHTFLTATNFNSQIIRKFAQLGCYFTVSAAELHSISGNTKTAPTDATPSRTAKQASDDLAAFIDCFFNVVPPSQLLLTSDSPWHTPQTIDDEYVRTQKNEPSNLPNVVEALELAVKSYASVASEDGKQSSPEADLLAKLKTIVTGSKASALKVFSIPEKDIEVISTEKAKEQDAMDNDEVADQREEKKNGKGKKILSDDDEDPKKKKKKGKGTRFQDSDASDNDAPDAKENNGKPKGILKKGGKKGGNDSEEEKPHRNTKKDSKKTKHNVDESDSDDEVNASKSKPQTHDTRKAAQKTTRSLDSVHYACLKCRIKLFTPADLIVPDDPSLCSTGFFVKPVSQDTNDNNDDEEEDENNRLLPRTLKISADSNGEIECRKCGAAKLGRAGFKLGVPGFGIKITPSKVEVVDTEVSLEELQRKSLMESERFALEAEALENASSDEGDDRKGKRTQKKNVKTNNKSNFTTFRNKNFAPKTVRLADANEELNHVVAQDSDEDKNNTDDETNRKKKGKKSK